ncbi:MAG: S-layer homology domain-containing protein [Clostridia bacterium]|nr:S-layer homology domain-containing protein [Clostridia bacterium]
MKKSLRKLVGILLAAALVFSLSAASFAAEIGTDIAGHAQESAMKNFIARGYLRGDGTGKINPDSTITRAEFAALVNRVTGYNVKSADIAKYTDVADGSWYRDDFAVALRAGYMIGTSATTMDPKGTLTAQQVDIVVSRLLGRESASTDRSPISRANVVNILNSNLEAIEGKGLPTTGTVYGTATLTYAEFYAGDVSSTESYDAITSATTGKSSTLKNTYSDFVSAEKNPNGYKILGVKNVPVAVAGKDAAAYKRINPSFVATAETPAQYKTVTVSGGKAAYSATVWNVKDTVKNARAALKTGSVWGDYEIDVFDNEGDGAKNYLRRDRQDGWAINSYIMGIILETSDGFKVGMQYLQNIWVQPYEVSFNVTADNTHNTHIAGQDNLAETDKLVGKTVTKITYIMPDCSYVYEFDGIYIKPIHAPVRGAFAADNSAFTVEAPTDLTNAKLTVNYTTGSGRQRNITALYDGELKASVPLDTAALAAADEGGVFSATISSDNFADIAVKFAMTATEKAQLEELVKKAENVLKSHDDAGVREHLAEAKELLADASATSSDAQVLIRELNGHLSVYESSEGGRGGSGGSGRGGH